LHRNRMGGCSKDDVSYLDRRFSKKVRDNVHGNIYLDPVLSLDIFPSFLRISLIRLSKIDWLFNSILISFRHRIALLSFSFGNGVSFVLFLLVMNYNYNLNYWCLFACMFLWIEFYFILFQLSLKFVDTEQFQRQAQVWFIYLFMSKYN
jgi:hypothetical protein